MGRTPDIVIPAPLEIFSRNQVQLQNEARRAAVAATFVEMASPPRVLADQKTAGMRKEKDELMAKYYQTKKSIFKGNSSANL